MKFTVAILSLCLLVSVTNAFSHSRHEKDSTSTDLELVTPKQIGYGGLGALHARSNPVDIIEDVGKAFCVLYKYSAEHGNGPSEIKRFIERKFPKKWHNFLFGKLVYKGIIAIVEISADLCGVPRQQADLYLENALNNEPNMRLPADKCLFGPVL